MELAGDILNPINAIDFAGGAYSAASRGDYGEAVLRTASALPIISAGVKSVKTAKNTPLKIFGDQSYNTVKPTGGHTLSAIKERAKIQ